MLERPQPFKAIREFIRLESSGGIVLFAAAIIALIIDNTPISHYYHLVLNTILGFDLGGLKLSKSVLLWINDGLMAIFFLLVGLEIKREMLEGELNNLQKSLLPAIAAVGGMLVPALIYVLFNWGDLYAKRGWAIPTATDIAFSLGILSLLGKRIPVSLKIFLMALAIFDDVGAIVIIAIFYTKTISTVLLLLALACLFVLFLLNIFKVMYTSIYIVVGFFLWLCVLKSGVHATLAGIVLALTIPLKNPKNLEHSPLRDLENALHPWVAFVILPIFALANAGVSFQGLTLSSFIGSVPLGIALGLFIGKQVGIWGATMLAVKCKIAALPSQMDSLAVYGLSLIAGVGFTMSLFIGGLAFGHVDVAYSAMVRVGVIVGSLLSGSLGYLVLHMRHANKVE